MVAHKAMRLSDCDTDKLLVWSNANLRRWGWWMKTAFDKTFTHTLRLFSMLQKAMLKRALFALASMEPREGWKDGPLNVCTHLSRNKWYKSEKSVLQFFLFLLVLALFDHGFPPCTHPLALFKFGISGGSFSTLSRNRCYRKWAYIIHQYQYQYHQRGLAQYDYNLFFSNSPLWNTHV